METDFEADPVVAYERLKAPYSLGKLIEWKHTKEGFENDWNDLSPYSLGKLIEWKQTGIRQSRETQEG